MREEIAAAVVFVTRLIKLNDGLPKEKIDEFSSHLSASLIDKFKNHWYADEPAKGQGYRCIRINSSEPIDPVLEKVASSCGLQYTDLNLPQELTLWVDPKEVCCRFGESQGAYCQLAVVKDDGNLENQAHTIDIENMLQQQQQRFNMKMNIVTTRTSVNKLKAMAMKSDVFQQQQHYKYNYNNKYQHNMFNNQHHTTSHQSPRPFHKPNHHKNGFRNNAEQSVNNYHGNKGSPVFNTGSGNFNSGVPAQGRGDRFHWVKNNKQVTQGSEQHENMRLSPN